MTRRRLSKQIRAQVLARDRYRCLMCGRGTDEVVLEIDHVVPVSKGGTDEIENLATLCRDCNLGKSAYRFTDYRQMAIIPPNMIEYLNFIHDPTTGDFQRFHLYLYYKNGVHSGDPDLKYHRTWTISGTVYDTSSEQEALVQRRRNGEQSEFLTDIKQDLVRQGKRLIVTEEGICKVGGQD